MNTKQKIGRACMIVGILLILGALALLAITSGTPTAPTRLRRTPWANWKRP